MEKAKVKFVVLQDNKPAILPPNPVWDSNEFDNFYDASDYLNEWMGAIYGPHNLTKPGSIERHGLKFEIRKES